jgi:hypothetical protein
MNMAALVQMISCPISLEVVCLEVWEVDAGRLVKEGKTLCTLSSKTLLSRSCFCFFVLTCLFMFRVTLEDLYNGKTSKLQLSKNVICALCSG